MGIWRHPKHGIAPGVKEVSKIDTKKVVRGKEVEHSDRAVRQGQMDGTHKAALRMIEGSLTTKVSKPADAEESEEPALRVVGAKRELARAHSEASSDWAAPIRPELAFKSVGNESSSDSTGLTSEKKKKKRQGEG